MAAVVEAYRIGLCEWSKSCSPMLCVKPDEDSCSHYGKSLKGEADGKRDRYSPGLLVYKMGSIR